jgi:hypothetical protein
VTFTKVTTTKLRALLQSSGTEEGKGAPGVQEWEVYDVPGTPDPQFDVQVQAKTQCIGGKAYVAVNAVNADSVSLDIELVTPYGSKKVTGVAPGKTAYQQFNSRLAIVPAGAATVKVTAGSVTTEIQAPYGGTSCG